MIKQKSKLLDTQIETTLRLKKAKALQLISDWVSLVGIEELSDKFIVVKKRPTNGDRETAKLKRIIGSCLLISTSHKKESEQEKNENRISNLDKVIFREELIDAIFKTLT